MLSSMCRARIYATSAERQRAYRERVRLRRSQPKDVIRERHYLRKWPSGKCFTFRFESAIVVISVPSNRNAQRWLGCRTYELTRLWAPDGHRKNLLTAAMAHACRQLHNLDVADAIISFADPKRGHQGGIYRAASWTCLGRSQASRGYLAPDGSILTRRGLWSVAKRLHATPDYEPVKIAAKLRFAFGITTEGKAAIRLKQESLRG
jgi:hypothetical protein